MQRCGWAGQDPLMVAYHDEEWGVPLHDDRGLFAFLILEGAQAGLSWSTILRKREAYRRAYDGFDPQTIAAYGPADEARLLADAGIVRNRLKIAASIANARAVLALQEEAGTLDRYLWQFVHGVPIVNHWETLAEIPTQSPTSAEMSKALKQRGFRFVGPTICYAFMQAVGMVNDHLVGCFRHQELS